MAQCGLNLVGEERVRTGGCGLVLILLISLLRGVPAAATEPLTDHSLVHAGQVRSYLEYVPDTLPATDVPLVLALHGGGGGIGGSAETMTRPRDPWSQWMRLADEHGFIVVYPDGIDGQWNDCRSEPDAETKIGTANDVGFLSAVIDDVAARHRVDLTRVYATGVSNGGMMAYRLGMELTHRLAGIGAVIANLPLDPEGQCDAPSLPISVVIVNGDTDPLMPWNGGCISTCVPRLSRGAVIAAEQTRDYWIQHNAASSHAHRHDYPDVDRTDMTTVTRWIYTSDSHGTQVAFLRVWRGGHGTPTRHGRPASIGLANRDIDAIAEIWDILKDHRRPGAPSPS